MEAPGAATSRSYGRLERCATPPQDPLAAMPPRVSGSGMPTRPPRTFAFWYLFGTLAFVALDLLFGAWAGAIRVPGLAGSELRWGYYVALLLLGAGAWAIPRAAPWIGAFESLVNLGVLFGGILLPVWSLGEIFLAGGEPADAVPGVARIVGTLLAGGWLIFGIYQGMLRERAIGRVSAVG